MHKITFITPVALDPLDLVLFGASAKPGLHFGTGLKYALAIFARLGVECTVSVKHPHKEVTHYPLMREPLEHRGVHIERVHLGPVELPFTTNLGRNWALWQGIRELVANTNEENGLTFFYDAASGYDYPDEYTVIEISSPMLEEIIELWNYFFLPYGRKVLATINNIEISEPEHFKTGAIYSRGYLACPDPHPLPLRYTYNFLGEIPLTEDRTAAQPTQLLHTAVGQLFGAQHDWIDTVLAAKEDHVEAKLNSFQFHMNIWEDWLEEHYQELHQGLRSMFNQYRQAYSNQFQEYEMKPWMKKQLDKIAKLFVLPDLTIGAANVCHYDSWNKDLWIEFAPDLFTTTKSLFLTLIKYDLIKPDALLAEYLLCPQFPVGAAIAKDGSLLPNIRLNIYDLENAQGVVENNGELTDTDFSLSGSDYPAHVMDTTTPTDSEASSATLTEQELLDSSSTIPMPIEKSTSTGIESTT